MKTAMLRDFLMEGVRRVAPRLPHAAVGAAVGALGGAGLGFSGGPELVDAAREAGGHIKGIGKNMKDILGKGAA